MIALDKRGGNWYYDYTTVINSTLKREITDFINHRPCDPKNFKRTPAQISAHITYEDIEVYPALDWFKKQVDHNAKWDLKIEQRWNDMFQYDIIYFAQRVKFIYEGMLITSEDLGNITYGYLGSAMGLGSTTLSAAGLIAGGSTDTQRDKDMVKYGINKFFNEYGSKYPVRWNFILK